MKIITIVGARPQFIKCAALSKELRGNNHEIMIHTGQHYDYEMSSIFFKEFDIPKPDYELNIGSGTHGTQTGTMLTGIEKILIKEKPDLVLVYGDTNSTLAGALAAAKMQIRLAHVEAGLRSFDRKMPEEINRILTDHMSNLLFCPTGIAIENLKKEGIKTGIYNVGDVMYDVMLYNKNIAEEKSTILSQLEIKNGQYFVVTLHRANNTDNVENLRNIVDALCEIDGTIIFPIHPRTLKFLIENGIYHKLERRVKIIKPLGYIDFLKLMNHAKKILTDSGGIQKEAYMLGIPCITLRDSTEWIETIESGWNVLVGQNKYDIIKNVKEFNPTLERKDMFGNGFASRKINDILYQISKLVQNGK